MNLLLDTCTFLWMAGDVERLSIPARKALEDARNHLILHQASLWEIQIKYQIGKLWLDDRPRSLVEVALREHDVHFHPMQNDDIWHLGKLPSHHRDPFDRILIAHALREGMTLVTPDPNIHKYPVVCLWD